MGAYNGGLIPKSNDMVKNLKVPQWRSLLETIKWNAVNPSSEKPKFGKGREKGEMKLISHANA